ncbi:hypothetical protein PF011_g4650 [Phytophthora fragariae]|uniref:Uncharacterized protein n=1 Tax=Phytophthora fragariae TaxID=53985 RepID=A0A6A3M1F1_9STRA|nr:hypothetical protein PF003_g27481 [Phytophthora fragariae]KAE8942938.1 hypothetical protein PF009_g7321 [Phytophthora fragariae]KAE9022033.1 hypothetical protein PF011_g4650 [Phytophthora fragariae]KAE9350893.1 hypothetical protein PF008_g6209 [Phytophthora fragariae]
MGPVVTSDAPSVAVAASAAVSIAAVNSPGKISKKFDKLPPSVWWYCIASPTSNAGTGPEYVRWNLA